MRLRREVSPYGEVRELFWAENAHHFAILRRGVFLPPDGGFHLLFAIVGFNTWRCLFKLFCLTVKRFF